MKKRTSLRAITLIVAFFWFSISWAQDNDPAESLVGTWTKLVQGRTITITITAEQELQVDFIDDSDVDVWSSFTVSGNQITITDEGGEYRADVPGTYSFKVTETSVSFTEVDDPVDGRRMLFAGDWSKAKE